LTEPHHNRAYAVIGLQNLDNFIDFAVALRGFVLREARR